VYVTREKTLLSKCYEKVLYAGPKSARNILTNLSPNPTRPEILQFCAEDPVEKMLAVAYQIVRKK